MKVDVLMSDEGHPQCRHFLGAHRWPLYWSLSELRACSEGGDFLFLVCCTEIVPKDIRDRYKHTLVLHESDLPRGRGWSPLAWQILEGKGETVISMCEAEDSVDSGSIWLKSYVVFEGRETNEEIHEKVAKKKLEMIEDALGGVEPIPTGGGADLLSSKDA